MRVVIRLMQAAPVYVVMFFLLNMLPDDIDAFGRTIVIGGVTVMILVQYAYMIPHVAEAGFDMLCTCGTETSGRPCCSCSTCCAASTW